ncbi:MAG: condensation domain-containing protein, partial [Parachlamydiales bacterium]
DNSIPENKICTLTPSEERFFFLSRFCPDSEAFNENIAIIFERRLDEIFLKYAFEKVIETQEILRSFIYIDEFEDPTLCILPEVFFELDITNSNDSSLNYHNTQRLVSDYINRPFIIYKWPLFRVSLIQVNNKSILTMVMHHIISDGYPSFTILINEVMYYYELISKGRDDKSILIKKIIQRSQITEAHQSSLYLFKNKQEHIYFWKKYLLGSNQNINFSKRISDISGYQYPYFSKFIAKKIRIPKFKNYLYDSPQLRCINGIDKYKFFFLSVLLKLFLDLFNQKEVCVGLPIFNRDNLEEIKKLIGYFGGVLVLRSKILENDCFEDVLLNVIKNYQQILPHANLPFQEIVKNTDQKWREIHKTPLFNILFVISSLEDMKISNSFSLLNPSITKIPYSIIFSINILNNDLISFRIDYDRDSFHDDDIMLLISNFQISLQKNLKIISNKSHSTKLLLSLTKKMIFFFSLIKFFNNL